MCEIEPRLFFSFSFLSRSPRASLEEKGLYYLPFGGGQTLLSRIEEKVTG